MVLNNGSVVYNGEVDAAINNYLRSSKEEGLITSVSGLDLSPDVTLETFEINKSTLISHEDLEFKLKVRSSHINHFSAAAIFIFDGEDGGIWGWNPVVNLLNATLIVKPSTSDPMTNEVYKGLAIANRKSGGATLYATNFRAGAVFVFDSSFNLVSKFTDPNPPAVPDGAGATRPLGCWRSEIAPAHPARPSWDASCPLLPSSLLYPTWNHPRQAPSACSAWPASTSPADPGTRSASVIGTAKPVPVVRPTAF